MQHSRGTQGRMTLKKLLLIACALIALVVILFFVLMRISYNQVPGDPLYGLKTATEQMFGGIKLTSTGKAEYNITLLESRLNELNRYALNISSSTPDTLTKIAEQSDAHTKDTLNILAGDKSIAAETHITTLAKLDGVIRAQETLGDTIEAFTPIADTIENNEKRVNDALKSAIADFVTQNATDTIEQFIANRITEVSQHISTIAPGSSAAKSVALRVTDTSEAVIDHKYAVAIISIIRADQAIAIDGYLWNAERGPVPGVPIDNGPIPEGN
jgi:hypothetical protein